MPCWLGKLNMWTPWHALKLRRTYDYPQNNGWIHNNSKDTIIKELLKDGLECLVKVEDRNSWATIWDSRLYAMPGFTWIKNNRWLETNWCLWTMLLEFYCRIIQYRTVSWLDLKFSWTPITSQRSTYGVLNNQKCPPAYTLFVYYTITLSNQEWLNRREDSLW